MSLRFSEAFGSNAPAPKRLGRITPVPQKELTAAELEAMGGMTASQRKRALMTRAFGTDPSRVARQALAAEQAAAVAAALPKASKLAELSDADLGAHVRRLLQGGE